MIVDTQSEFSDAQAVTASAISANVLDIFSVGAGAGADTGPNARLDVGLQNGLYLVVQTTEACTDSGSDATLTVTLESADNAALSTNAQVHFSSGALPFASYSAAGSQFVVIPLPPGLYRRYVGVRYTVGSGPLTAGKFDAFLTPTPQANRPTYKSGFIVQ